MRLCALTSGDPSLSPKPIRGAVSARRNCFTQDEEEQSCFDEGIQYSLDDVHKVRCPHTLPAAAVAAVVVAAAAAVAAAQRETAETPA